MTPRQGGQVRCKPCASIRAGLRNKLASRGHRPPRGAVIIKLRPVVETYNIFTEGGALCAAMVMNDAAIMDDRKFKRRNDTASFDSYLRKRGF